MKKKLPVSQQPAFPLNLRTTDQGAAGFVNEIEPGLTKREYFAGLAMQGMAHANECHHDPEFSAQYSVQMADALLAELAK